ncbi:SH3 domain-containing protein [Actinacidiphila glaucinigra]|uniref:SH3 domain-containing protein n=1 Tax=Actinacidiphila glaucinigra TaxID=235986 RepID=UPI0035DDB69F
MSKSRRAALVTGAAAMAGAVFLVLGGAAEAVAAPSLVYYPSAPGVRVNVRSGPGTSFQLLRTLPYDQKMPIFCQTPGETVSGYYGTSNIWDRIGPDQYVADVNILTGSDGYVAPRCT